MDEYQYPGRGKRLDEMELSHAEERPSGPDRSFGPEALETRNLLSTLIGSKPTIDAFDGNGVTHNKFGGLSITQPAIIQVFGTAQPGAPGSTVPVSIYAEDS